MYTPKLNEPIVDNFENYLLSLPIGLRLEKTLIPMRVIPPFPLKINLKGNFDNVRATFKKIKVVILLLDFIQYMLFHSKFFW